MDLDRFLGLPGTADGRKVVTLMADPSMTDADGQPAGFLSLVDKGANLRRFQVVKAADLEPHQGPTTAPGSAEHDQAWLGRFLSALGLGGLAAKVGLTTKGDDAPLTFDAAITAERLRRARWEATDALWEVIGNVMASDLEDKPGAVGLALDQFRATVMGLVQATTTMKAEDLDQALEGLRTPPEGAAGLTSKAGRVISARNLATIEAAREAMAQAAAALDNLISRATPDDSPTDSFATKGLTWPDPHQEDHAMAYNPRQLQELATAASNSAITAAKAAGVKDPAELARIGAGASTEVFKGAVMGPAQPAMPTNALGQQMAESGGMGPKASDPLAMMTEALNQVRGLATKVDELTKVIKGHGEGEEREPGILELATKAAELADATATKVAKIQGTPAAPRGAGDPSEPTKVTKAEDGDGATWAGSAFDFGTPTAQG